MAPQDDELVDSLRLRVGGRHPSLEGTLDSGSEPQGAVSLTRDVVLAIVTNNHVRDDVGELDRDRCAVTRCRREPGQSVSGVPLCDHHAARVFAALHEGEERVDIPIPPHGAFHSQTSRLRESGASRGESEKDYG